MGRENSLVKLYADVSVFLRTEPKTPRGRSSGTPCIRFRSLCVSEQAHSSYSGLGFMGNGSNSIRTKKKKMFRSLI